MKFSTTITKKYWEMKMEDIAKKRERGVSPAYFFEYKEFKPFWSGRFYRMIAQGFPIYGVFLLGSKPHRVRVLEIYEVKTQYIPEKYADAIKTDKCWVVKCVLKEEGEP